jgi:hypothetical protein
MFLKRERRMIKLPVIRQTRIALHSRNDPFNALTFVTAMVQDCGPISFAENAPVPAPVSCASDMLITFDPLPDDGVPSAPF